MSREAIEQLHKNWQKNLFDNYDAIEHLREARGIRTAGTIKALELGLAKVPKKENLPPEIFKSLKSFGLTEPGIAGTVSLPLRRRTGVITNFCFLDGNGDPAGDRLIRKGGVINGKAFRAFRTILVTDNLPDFFTYFQNVKENIVPLIESERMPVDFTEAVINSEVDEIVLINDSPYWDPLRARLSKCDVKVYGISLPEGKSVSEYLKKSSGMKLVAYIEGEKAKLVKERVRESGTEESKDDENVPEYLKFIDGTGEARFQGEDRSYRVRGFNRDGFEKMVQVSLEVDGRVFPDKVDLSRSRSRVNFANSAAAEFEMSVDLVRNDLAFIYKTLDKLQDERFREKAGLGEKNIYTVTPDDISKAIETARSRDILDELLIKDTERTGFMDEDINKKLFYISATSRLTGKPVSVLDISPSGTGKSFCMSSILELMPPDEADINSRLTPKTLYYKNEEDIRGKVLAIEELVGIEEALDSIRMIVSAEMLSTSGTEKDPRTGMMRSVKFMINASIPVVSGGTRDLFDEETLSRFILTYNDLSQEHVKRILKAQARKYSAAGTKAGFSMERILKKHRDIQKSFDKNCVVIIPFADRIMLNPRLHIVTRKQEQYLRLIYNIAFIRQHSREKRREVDKNGSERTFIYAERDDAATANEIMRYVFRYALCHLTKRQHDAHQAILIYCSEKVKEKRIGLYECTFSRREIREHAGWDEATARRLLKELEGLEYIRRVSGARQGTRYLYKLVPFDQVRTGNDDLHLLDPESI